MSRHHFLPIFYLKQWIDPQSVMPNRTPYVWKISRNGHRRHHHPAERIFWIENGNTLESTNGELNETTEHVLSQVEGVIARVIREVFPARAPLDHNQGDALHMFFSSMFVRVPSARESLRKTVSAYARIERETALFAGLPAPDTSLMERNAFAHSAHSSLFAVLPELERMTHRLLLAPTGESFVTSDRPAIIWAPIGPAGLANRTCEASFPLSPNALLLLTHDRGPASCYCDVDSDEVRYWNRRTISHCTNWFIANRRNVDSQ